MMMAEPATDTLLIVTLLMVGHTGWAALAIAIRALGALVAGWVGEVRACVVWPWASVGHIGMCACVVAACSSQLTGWRFIRWRGKSPAPIARAPIGGGRTRKSESCVGAA